MVRESQNYLSKSNNEILRLQSKPTKQEYIKNNTSEFISLIIINLITIITAFIIPIIFIYVKHDMYISLSWYTIGFLQNTILYIVVMVSGGILGSIITKNINFKENIKPIKKHLIKNLVIVIIYIVLSLILIF